MNTYRFTVPEVAEFLGRKPSWVYNRLKLAGKRVKHFVPAPVFYDLFKFAFKAAPYELYPYEWLTEQCYMRRLENGSIRQALTFFEQGTSVESATIEYFFALRLRNPKTSTVQQLSYLRREGRVLPTRAVIKDYIYQKCARLVLEKGMPFMRMLPCKGLRSMADGTATCLIRTLMEKDVNEKAQHSSRSRRHRK